MPHSGHFHTTQRLLLLISLWLLLLTACGTQQAPLAPSTALPTTMSPTQTQITRTEAPADTLRWSLEGVSDLRALDPARSGDSQSVTVANLVFSGLVRTNAQLEIMPEGAEDWSVSADGTMYRFTIREDLKFADGTAVTAQDFVNSITRALAPETASYGAATQLGHIVGAADVVSGESKTLRGLQALDERTLLVRLDGPIAYFLAQLTYPYTFVIPDKLLQTGTDWEKQSYGTGPYRISEWKPNSYIDLVANTFYWAGTPGIPKIRISFNPDSETAYQQYMAGELDIMGGGQNSVPTARIAEVQSLPDFRTAADLRTRYIGFNNKLAPFDNLEVRRAFALAIDKRILVDQALMGQAIAADRILPVGLIGTQQPIRALAFDPEAARQALSNAGYPDGDGLPPITLTYGQEGDNDLVVAALQQDWKTHLGVEITLQPYDLTTFSDMMDRTFETPAQGLQLYYSAWGADYPDPQNFLSQQLQSGMPNNNGHWSDATFDQLVKEADRLGDRTQIDRRIKLYNQAEQIAIDKVGWLPLFYPRINVLLNPRVSGITIVPSGLIISDYTQLRLN